MIEQKELDEMLEEEKPFTPEEETLLRMMTRDRIENRFRMAQKAACEMDLKTLRSVTDELCRLDDLAVKLTEGTL